jgi:hypothetical protein
VTPRNVPRLGEPQEPPQDAHQAPDQGQPTEAAEESQEGQEERPASREARYRTERNEARQQVTELTERIARMQDAEATRLAAEYLHQPADLVLFGHMPDVIGEDGLVDPAKVRTTAKELITDRPGLAKGARVPVQSFGQGRRTSAGTGVDWGTVLRGA